MSVGKKHLPNRTYWPAWPRTGVAFSEVIVAAGIVVILFSLWLPELQAWRERMRQVRCQDNLRSIGAALHSYHARHTTLPPGYRPGDFTLTDDGKPTWSGNTPSYCWAAFLLPDLGHGELYEALDLGEMSLENAVADPDRAALLKTSVAIYRCPSDKAGDTLASAPLHKEKQVLNPHAIPASPSVAGASSSYVGNGGYYQLNRPLPNSPDAENNGLLFVSSNVCMDDITDGLSHTIAVGERAWFQGSSTWVGMPNVTGTSSGDTGTCLGRVVWKINELPLPFWELPPPEFGLATPENDFLLIRRPSARNGYSSYHPNGAHFLMADGSVHFLTNDIDFRSTIPVMGADPAKPIPDIEKLGLFQRLGIRNDGLRSEPPDRGSRYRLKHGET